MCGTVPGQVDVQKRFKLALMWKRHMALLHIEGGAYKDTEKSMICPQRGQVELHAVMANILDASTKIEGTWYAIYGRLCEGAHD